MNNITASEAAKKLANDFDIDLHQITGTGVDGMITKGDVQSIVDEKATGNVMSAKKNARIKHSEAMSSTLEEKSKNGVIVPSEAELLAIITDMRSEIEEMREAQAGMLNRESQTRDLTDEMFWIAKPNGHRWEERRIVDGRTMEVEFIATAFFGPFEHEEQIASYVDAKKEKREDSWIDWQNVYTLDGRAARALDAEEKAQREAQFASSAPVNALDRNIFAANHTGHTPGIGQIVGQPS